MLDAFVDYKQETLRAFLKILQPPAGEAQDDADAGGKGKGDEEGKAPLPPLADEFQKLLERIGKTRLDNVLATFSVEYAESRGNLNKEQAFFYLALYQYAMSRQSLRDIYYQATTEKHPDVQRVRQIAMTEKTFSAFTCPYLPSSVAETRGKLMEASKPTQTLHQTYQLEEMKESLPNSGGYLIIQLSDDEQYLFCGFMTISKARDIKYHMTKLHLGNENRAKLLELVKSLA